MYMIEKPCPFIQPALLYYMVKRVIRGDFAGCSAPHVDQVTIPIPNWYLNTVKTPWLPSTVLTYCNTNFVF